MSNLEPAPAELPCRSETEREQARQTFGGGDRFGGFLVEWASTLAASALPNARLKPRS